MITLKQAVIVEGKYDKIRLSNIIDALIITTDGFSVFKNEEKKELIRLVAKSQGVIIMTDSDSAGFMIRNYLNDLLSSCEVINVCLPEILGKEKRKASPSAENLLGVEGTEDEIIKTALEKFGVTTCLPPRGEVTKAMLYEDGFSGAPNCAEKREKLLKALGIPLAISPAQLPKVITLLAGKEGYEKAKAGLN